MLKPWLLDRTATGKQWQYRRQIVQAQVSKRRNLNHVVGLALVIGLIAILALNVVMLNRSSNDAEPGAAPQADVAQLAQQRFIEAKTARIDAMVATIGAQYVAPALASSSDGSLNMY
jgi:hypothetical protein